MSRARILLILGVWVAVLPYLGFPFFWKNILLTVSGLGLVFFSYLFYRESKLAEGSAQRFDNFSENQ
jgi:hypothetical protein